MANLIVRNIREDVAQALKVRASQMGMSAEAFHRQLLEQVLMFPKKKRFADVISEMPDVGQDSDFDRHQDQSVPKVFD